MFYFSNVTRSLKSRQLVLIRQYKDTKAEVFEILAFSHGHDMAVVVLANMSIFQADQKPKQGGR